MNATDTIRSLKEPAAIGQVYNPAMDVKTPEEASEVFEALVARNILLSGRTRAEAAEVEKSNLGYYAGYFDSGTRARVQKLFDCVHPVLGDNLNLTPEELFKAGEQAAKTGKIAIFNQPKEMDSEYEVVCVNRSGIEEQFDEDTTYVAYKHLNTDMIWVVDKFGVKREFFKDRFKAA